MSDVSFTTFRFIYSAAKQSSKSTDIIVAAVVVDVVVVVVVVVVVCRKWKISLEAKPIISSFNLLREN